MKTTIVFLTVLLSLITYRLLFGDGSLQELNRLQSELRDSRSELIRLQNRNQGLRAEVEDLKKGLDAVEERVRLELGMIGNDETFYQFIGSDFQSREQTDEDDYRGYLNPWGKAGFVEEISAITTPMMVCVGEFDGAINADAMQATYMSWYDGCELEVIQNAGHYPMQETPVYLATMMERFIAKHA